MACGLVHGPALFRKAFLFSYTECGWSRRLLAGFFFLGGLYGAPTILYAQAPQVIPLTLDTLVSIAIENSYRIRQLRLDIAQERAELQAELADLKSQVFLDLSAPQIDVVSESVWDSDLGRNVIVRQNTRMWEMDLSVRQPVILFGYPTNGYLSLNSEVYRYAQFGEDASVIYYNRYFVAYEQPFFSPNTLKNDIELANLDLKEGGLAFQENVVDLYDDLADDYFGLFEHAYERVIYEKLVDNLEQASAIAANRVEEDSTRQIEVRQLRVALLNAREQLNQARSEFRRRAAELKQDLDLAADASLDVEPSLEIRPVQVDRGWAIEYGYALNPALQRQQIDKQMSQIWLENEKGEGDIQVELEITYGLEKQDPRFGDLWSHPASSYTVGLDVHIPLWDWGEHEKEVQAARIDVLKAKLAVEQTREEIRSDIASDLRDLKEFQQRTAAMQEALEVAELNTAYSLSQYRQGDISVLALLQTFARQEETEENLLEAYLGYRRALLSLEQHTYYDFEREMPLIERFGLNVGANGPS